MRHVERPHPKQIPPRKAAPEPLGQVCAESLQQNFAIVSAILSLLFKLHDAAADFPIGGGEDGVDGAGGLPARLRQQRRDAARPRAVIRRSEEHTSELQSLTN